VTELYVEEHGAGEAILCIHGTGSSALAWVAAVPALARHGRVITYDRRGYTRSAAGAPPFRTMVADHTADAAALLEARDATPAVVIGRSYGGSVALDLALRHPGHVRALVLLEGAPESLDPEAERWLDEVRGRALAHADQPDAAAASLFTDVLGAETWTGLPDEIRAMFTGNGAAIVAELRGDLMLRAGPDVLARIQAPALVVTARDSPPAFRRANDVLAAAMPNARSALVGGGHLVDPADPVVLAFLEEVLSGR
jgi:esterase